LRKLNFQEVLDTIIGTVAQEHDLDIYAVVLLKTASILKTSSGKIQRQACRAGFLAGSLDVVADWSKNPAHKKGFKELKSDINSIDILLKIKTSTPDNSLCLLITYVQNIVSEIFGISTSQTNVQQPLHNMGFDSLMAVEIKDRLNTDLGVEVPLVKFIESITIASLAELLNDQILVNNQTTSVLASTDNDPFVSDLFPLSGNKIVHSDSSSALILQQLEQLSDEDVNSLLSSMLSK
jgi:acyl carrier protein